MKCKTFVPKVFSYALAVGTYISINCVNLTIYSYKIRKGYFDGQVFIIWFVLLVHFYNYMYDKVNLLTVNTDLFLASNFLILILCIPYIYTHEIDMNTILIIPCVSFVLLKNLKDTNNLIVGSLLPPRDHII